MQRVKIWDSFVRLSHWLIVLLVGLMWFTAEEGYMEWHLRLAPVLGALVITRVLWGVFGSESARFSYFLKGPKAVVHHLNELKQGTYKPSNTHNAAGGWAAVLLLLLLVLQFATGLFATDDIFYSGPLASSVSSGFSEVASDFHEIAFNILLALVIVHVIAIVLYRIKGINLIAAMLHGYREGVVAPRLVSGLLGIIAAAVIAAALFYWIN
ncbi:cytochrome b/b6 domain-containing protein [Pseudidiomarina woesei]|uniref:Cytochrome b n=1 Tax=Pseudidiomarina woesei TaxID=1381080 RepID=A0A0K6H184_9GAMM|nr:cytochrome b/b6 domain-containing protein [Pseudidiomarina woesei]CUA84635.1 Cytochrome b [Pseudidiomarina woesei]